MQHMDDDSSKAMARVEELGKILETEVRTRTVISYEQDDYDYDGHSVPRHYSTVPVEREQPYTTWKFPATERDVALRELKDIFATTRSRKVKCVVRHHLRLAASRAKEMRGSPHSRRPWMIGLLVLLAALVLFHRSCFARRSAPLHMAVRRGNVALVQSLVAKGANINAQDEYGRTPLMITVLESGWQSQSNATNTWRLIEVLLQLGADVNAVDEFGNTALHETCRRRSSELVNLLLFHNADTGSRVNGCTPLHLLFLGHSTCATPFFLSTNETEACEIVCALINHGANVNARCDYYPLRDATALHFAVQLKSLPIIQILCEAGADTHAKDGEGRTAGAIAVHWGYREISAYLGTRQSAKR